MDTVPKGEIVLGHEVAETENLKVGDTVKLMSRDFKPSQTTPAAG